MTSLTEDVRRSAMVCILTVPATMTSHDLMKLMAPYNDVMEHMKIIRDSTPNQYMVLIKFCSQVSLLKFYQQVSVDDGLLHNQIIGGITEYSGGLPDMRMLDWNAYVRLCVWVIRSRGDPQDTVLAPFLFTLYTTNFNYNSEFCHIQKYTFTTQQKFFLMLQSVGESLVDLKNVLVKY